MTVLLTHSEVTYQGDDASTDFPTTFRFLDDSHLTVEISTSGGAYAALVRGVDFEVAGAGAIEPGGTVTLTGHGVLASAETLRIQRNTTDEQPTSFGTFTRFNPERHELEFDRRTLRSQELNRRISTLEAGGAPVSLAAAFVSHTFTAQEPIEDSFPFNVACAGTPAAVFLARIENLDEPTEVLPCEGLLWGTPALNAFTVNNIEGLTPGDQYRVKFLVLT